MHSLSSSLQSDHAIFNEMGSKLFKRKLNREQYRESADPAAIEMRAFSSGGGFVDPHY